MLRINKFASAAFLAGWILLLSAQAQGEEPSDLDMALGAVFPAGPDQSLGDYPMPRVCGRYSLQIARYLKLVERAEVVGDRVLAERIQGQVLLIEARAATRCPQLDMLVAVAMDPKAIASSQVCLRYAFQIARFETMATRANTFADEESADVWREQSLTHSAKLREIATPVCPELEDDAVKKAKEFAKLMKLAAKVAISYLSLGTFPF